MKRNNLNNRNFTLIELLVMIAIIAITTRSSINENKISSLPYFFSILCIQSQRKCEAITSNSININLCFIICMLLHPSFFDLFFLFYGTKISISNVEMTHITCF